MSYSTCPLFWEISPQKVFFGPLEVGLTSEKILLLKLDYSDFLVHYFGSVFYKEKYVLAIYLMVPPRGDFTLAFRS